MFSRCAWPMGAAGVLPCQVCNAEREQLVARQGRRQQFRTLEVGDGSVHGGTGFGFRCASGG